jgi:hypothetical protein
MAVNNTASRHQGVQPAPGRAITGQIERQPFTARVAEEARHYFAQISISRPSGKLLVIDGPYRTLQYHAEADLTSMLRSRGAEIYETTTEEIYTRLHKLYMAEHAEHKKSGKSREWRKILRAIENTAFELLERTR